MTRAQATTGPPSGGAFRWAHLWPLLLLILGSDLSSTALVSAQSGQWRALLVITPGTDRALAQSAHTAMAAQLSTLGIELVRVPPPTDRLGRVPHARQVAARQHANVVYYLLGEPGTDAALCVVDPASGQTTTRPLTLAQDSPRAAAEAAGIIARQAALALIRSTQGQGAEDEAGETASLNAQLQQVPNPSSGSREVLPLNPYYNYAGTPKPFTRQPKKAGSGQQLTPKPATASRTRARGAADSEARPPHGHTPAMKHRRESQGGTRPSSIELDPLFAETYEDALTPAADSEDDSGDGLNLQPGLGVGYQLDLVADALGPQSALTLDLHLLGPPSWPLRLRIEGAVIPRAHIRRGPLDVAIQRLPLTAAIGLSVLQSPTLILAVELGGALEFWRRTTDEHPDIEVTAASTHHQRPGALARVSLDWTPTTWLGGFVRVDSIVFLTRLRYFGEDTSGPFSVLETYSISGRAALGVFLRLP